MAKDDPVIHVWQGKVESGYPDGVLGYLQPHEHPDAHEIATIRQFFPQADLSDYEIRDTVPGRVVFVDKATSEEYVRDESLPLMARDPRATGIVCFVIDRAGRLHYLRPRAPREPQESIPVSTYVVHGPLEAFRGQW
jgi:hypothetical protein